MPRKYSEIESPEILEQLIHTRFEDRGIIDDLLKLKSYVKTGANSMAGNMQFRFLRSKYRQEYLSFLEQESPERYQAELNAHKDQQVEAAQLSARQEQEEIEQLADWLAAGGLR